jgi:hypothetical protein
MLVHDETNGAEDAGFHWFRVLEIFLIYPNSLSAHTHQPPRLDKIFFEDIYSTTMPNLSPAEKRAPADVFPDGRASMAPEIGE